MWNMRHDITCKALPVRQTDRQTDTTTAEPIFYKDYTGVSTEEFWSNNAKFPNVSQLTENCIVNRIGK